MTELMKTRSDSSIYLPAETTTVSVIKPAEVKLSEKERLEYAEVLKTVQSNLVSIEEEFEAVKKEFKSKISAAKAEFEKTLRAVTHGSLFEERANCTLTWTPHKNEVEITYIGRTLEKRPPKKSDEKLFESLFPEDEPPKEIN